MKNILYWFFLLMLVSTTATAQQITFKPISSMPEPVSNNAVTEALVNGVPHAYSFSGIDTTKIWSGIHLNSYRYNTQTDTWTTLDPLPDTEGKIAAAANVIKNKIYITGGYNVTSNGNEVSSDKIHIFDPETNTYLPNGAPIPVPIDDHVQGVWRDSLLYLVTGWSNNGNVDNVQIYNPSTNSWSVGTPVPSGIKYEVFGGSGTIVGDTIFYSGGAWYGSNFPLGAYYRKGVIDPNDPTSITWTEDSGLTAVGYRQGASKHKGFPFWMGGSGISYNYNGISYASGLGVQPEERIIFYNTSTGEMEEIPNVFPPIMDLRGVAKINQDQFIVAGGMTTNQQVTDQAFLITIDQTLTSNSTIKGLEFSVFPNPATEQLVIQLEGEATAELLDAQGKSLRSWQFTNQKQASIKEFPTGIYFLKIQSGKEIAIRKLIFE